MEMTIEELESVLVRAPTQQPPLPQGCTCDNDLLDLARRLSGRSVGTGREALCEIEDGWFRLLGQRDGALRLAEERGHSRDKNAEDLRAARALLASALSALTSLELGEQVSDFAKQLEKFLYEMHREHG